MVIKEQRNGRKPVRYGLILKLTEVTIKKQYVLPCDEKVSQGGSVTTKFNTSNFHKHLMIHKDKFQCLLEEEKRRKEASNKTKRAGLKQEKFEIYERKTDGIQCKSPKS